VRGRCARELNLLPHPVCAVLLFPAGQATSAKFQKQAIVVRDQSAAAEIAESKIDVRAGSSTDAL
jgi:hypothetical protein